MEIEQTLFVKMALDAWDTYVSRTQKLFDTFTDAQLLGEVAPGRNRGVYLLGHLTCVHDRMLPLLDFGEAHYPGLTDIFLHKPDKTTAEIPSTQELRRYWNEVNSALNENFQRLTPEEWFQKHTSVSAADFEKEPQRNKLNVVINRTNHLANHYGQLVFLKHE